MRTLPPSLGSAPLLALRLTALAAIGSFALLAGCATTSPADATGSASSVMPEHGAAKSANPGPTVGADPGHAGAGTALVPAPGHELAAFALGCFWGSEDTFRHVKGVTATAVGYSGGHTEAPTYETVCSHKTGHAETVIVEYDPSIVSYDKLLTAFWTTHDPTTKDRQGPDVGDQYRSAIFTFSPAQEATARASMAANQQKLGRPITTQIAPIGRFWKAEEYHQQYDEKTGRASCAKPGGDAI